MGHAAEASPEECCGLLLALGDCVDTPFRAHNAEESPTRFQIDPLDHFAAIRAARASGRRIAGVYHSHPAGPALPSRSDLAEASYAEFVYVIIGLGAGPPAVRAWRLDEGTFIEEPLTIIDAPGRG